MSDSPPGSLRSPTPIASVLVAVGVLALPAATRDRYSDEFRAELCFLRRRRQVAQAASLLAGSLALRQALKEAPVVAIEGAGRHWTCRIRRHQYLRVNDDNPENRRNQHRECIHCGKIKEINEYTPSDGKYLGAIGPPC